MFTITFLEYGLQGGKLSEDAFNVAMPIALMNLNNISFCKLENSTLTPYQSVTVTEIACKYADWIDENSDFVNRVIDSYSINNVSVNYANSSTVMMVGGCIIPKHLYSRFLSTNLGRLVL